MQQAARVACDERATLTLVAGPALAVIQFGMANPVAAEVMQATAGTLTGGRVAVVTVSSVLPVVTLFVPLLLIGVAIYALTDISAIRTQARPAIFRIPAAASLERFRAAVRAASVPDQYRTILNLTHVPPKHIPLGSQLFHDLAKSAGKLKSFGIDLAQKASQVSGAG